MRPSFAVLVGALLAAGCLNARNQQQDDSDPLVLGTDTRSRLVGSAAGAGPPKPATFDPAATGGKNLSVKNSFNRTTPGAGTGTSTGNFASATPPTQIGGAAPVSPPALQGVSYGEVSNDSVRTAGGTRTPPAPPPVVQPTAEVSPFGPTPPPVTPAPPKLGPPENDPPAAPPVIAPPTELPATPPPRPPARPPLPELEKPTPPLPPATARDPLPNVPLAPAVIPSPTQVPIPGLEAAPKLPAPEPIRPK
jgi:hypothetical protein